MAFIAEQVEEWMQNVYICLLIQYHLEPFTCNSNPGSEHATLTLEVNM